MHSAPQSHYAPRARLYASVALAALIAGLSAGCKTTRQPDPTTTSTIGAPVARSATDWQRASVDWGEHYRRNPNDPQVAIGYAQSLRALGQRAQAVAVLERASIQNPRHMELLGAYGRALADVGQFQQALDVLNRAHTPDQPNWRILSAQGAVLDQMGRHDEARRYYATALKIVPNEPSILSNFGLSLALSKDLVQAEQMLRRAAVAGGTDPRIRQNLALVIGLQGRFAEAEAIARADLPPAEAAANVAYLRQMIAEQRAQVAQQPPRKPARPAARPAPRPQG